MHDYLAAQRGKCFDLGKHDCFTFTNGAWRAMHGRGYADDFVGKYAALGPKAFARLMKETFGAVRLPDALDIGLTRVVGFPPRGALVITKNAQPYLTGFALGICCGVTSVFLNGSGVIHLSTEDTCGAWT
jgi:hypothetical protein